MGGGEALNDRLGWQRKREVGANRQRRSPHENASASRSRNESPLEVSYLIQCFSVLQEKPETEQEGTPQDGRGRARDQVPPPPRPRVLLKCRSTHAVCWSHLSTAYRQRRLSMYTRFHLALPSSINNIKWRCPILFILAATLTSRHSVACLSLHFENIFLLGYS